MRQRTEVLSAPASKRSSFPSKSANASLNSRQQRATQKEKGKGGRRGRMVLGGTSVCIGKREHGVGIDEVGGD